MHVTGPTRCLVLACGNPLRSDDGVGPRLISWAQEKFDGDATVRLMYRQQWTPELADDISHAEAVIFIDASTEAPPGTVQLRRVSPGDIASGVATHHLHAPELLALTHQLYESTHVTSLLLTIGVKSTEFGENLTDPVRASLGTACDLLEKLVKNPHDSTLLSAVSVS